MTLDRRVIFQSREVSADQVSADLDLEPTGFLLIVSVTARQGNATIRPSFLIRNPADPTEDLIPVWIADQEIDATGVFLYVFSPAQIEPSVVFREIQTGIILRPANLLIALTAGASVTYSAAVVI